LHALSLRSDDEVRTQLTALPGIGEWTSDWFLARHLARPRAWPAGDLGVRKGASRFYGDGRDLTTDEVRTLGERFDPFQNLTAHYLLAGLLRAT
jgi:DNA-3-methyladenine glycosylase II